VQVCRHRRALLLTDALATLLRSPWRPSRHTHGPKITASPITSGRHRERRVRGQPEERFEVRNDRQPEEISPRPPASAVARRGRSPGPSRWRASATGNRPPRAIGVVAARPDHRRAEHASAAGHTIPSPNHRVRATQQQQHPRDHQPTEIACIVLARGDAVGVAVRVGPSRHERRGDVAPRSPTPPPGSGRTNASATTTGVDAEALAHATGDPREHAVVRAPSEHALMLHNRPRAAYRRVPDNAYPVSGSSRVHPRWHRRPGQPSSVRWTSEGGHREHDLGDVRWTWATNHRAPGNPPRLPRGGRPGRRPPLRRPCRCTAPASGLRPGEAGRSFPGARGSSPMSTRTSPRSCSGDPPRSSIGPMMAVPDAGAIWG